MNAHGTSPGPSRIAIDGKLYDVVSLAELARRAGRIELPDPAPGWATAVVEGHAVAAWFEGAS